ncbi:MAG: DUF1211 domain-containing protein [Saprospiraceae bacterium]|nr:TMEM175 family protein [Candidatus Brachybacter algidus]MBL0118171.1 DUF1211 domain-containing protein [Candidatus Brachybacter algidus]
MNKNRLEAFSDGVLAIIITIMVLEFKVPHGSGFEDLKPLIPKVLSYILSFIYIGIYWGNHHHLLHTVRQVNSGMIWANLHLLFWLSLIPFATDWMGENHFSPNTVAVYGFILLMCGAAFGILQLNIQKHTHDTDAFKIAFSKLNIKSYVSTASYITSIVLAYQNVIFSEILFVAIAILWIIPDKHLEGAIKSI